MPDLMEILTIITSVLGVLLMVLELVFPGGIAFSVGLSTIIVGLLYQFSLVSNPMNIFLLWCSLSVVAGAVGVYVVKKLFGSGVALKEYYDEDVDAYGKYAVVTETINEKRGRISFQGTGWKAVSMNGAIKKGERVKIVGRDNITWIVEPAEECAVTKTLTKEK